MNIPNEQKLPLRDMKPEEIKEILNTPYEDVEMFSHDDKWLQVPHGRLYDVNEIYRTKPKKLTVMELYEKVVFIDHEKVPTNGQMRNEILELIRQTEGFNIEGEG